MSDWTPSYFNVLVIDDEKNICRAISMVLEGAGYQVLTAESGEAGLEIIQSEPIDLVLLDLFLPGMNGHEVLDKIKQFDSAIGVVMISGHGKIDDAVRAVKNGAYNFIEKPIEREVLLLAVERCLEKRYLLKKMKSLEEEQSSNFQMIGRSPAMEEVFQQIERVAFTESWVMVRGESGTGKELVARAIHENSPRKKRPFVKVNCAAIPDELIESELFGHEKGAFTGAIRTKQGEFERAHTGTIFLDEIADMSLPAQAKVLRVLNSGDFSRVGGDRTIHVDLRVIAATNRDLEDDIKNGRFREDLYFRLNVIPINLPPLRERQEDIPILLESFLHHFCSQYNYPQITTSPQAMQKIQAYPWPGNIRELKNIAERLAILAGPHIDVDSLPSHIHKKRSMFDMRKVSGQSLREVREEVEKNYILFKLDENDWNISRTALALGVERTNLHKKIKTYGIKK